MSEPPRVLLLGAGGRIGRELVRALAGSLRVVTSGRRAKAEVVLDLARPEGIEPALDASRPACVINAAAATAVDAVEADPEAARAVNAVGPGLLAQACARRGVPLVHYSTDYVFDGTAGRPYREEDAPHPVNAYGRTKLEGEERVRLAGGPHLILRTSWVFARGVPGWLEHFERGLRAGGVVEAVADQRGSPSWSRCVAEGTAAVLERWRGLGPRGTLDPGATAGTYHMACGGGASWFEVAGVLRERLGAASAVRPIQRAKRRDLAARPADSRLDCERLARVFGVRLPAWREALARCLAEPPA